MATRSRSLERSIDDLVYRSNDPTERIRQSQSIAHALIDIVDERRRQEEIGDRRRREGVDWRSCADPAMTGGDGTRMAVLTEEVGEVANAVLEAGYAIAADEDHLRAELVQVAAVSLAWIEAIDARRLPF